ncbi:MAG: aminotransferase class I/II-fold pyridoxal phosphate-dependent enzyme [Candidatus Aureabacteria bacterium]|nr:aminotransferase class I/II-fold pyridoxal phosphate-dependent enzyme [Candidatus Auribacterota bacterium]
MYGRTSWLPPGGKNLFQGIKEKTILAKERGIEIIDMSIGEPSFLPLETARKKAARELLGSNVLMQGYQDNWTPAIPDFAKLFALFHMDPQLEGRSDVKFLGTPGTKSMLGVIIRACGEELKLVGTHTNPGYPTPAVQCGYQDIQHYALKTNPENNFRFSTADIKKGTELLMLNYPHNPSGQVATREFWEEICAYCEKNGIRLVNDAAYAGLVFSKDHCTLADVAVNYPNLSWVELYTASKLINVTGWRIGAMVGSPDFVDDIATIKGNTDSGLTAPLAMGVLEAIQYDQAGITANKNIYRVRLQCLIGILEELGMQLAVYPGAGFFTLWKVPKKAFGKTIKNAKEFNDLMIRLGIVGVPFDEDDSYIRYAVVNNIIPLKNDIISAFEKAAVSY